MSWIQDFDEAVVAVFYLKQSTSSSEAHLTSASIVTMETRVRWGHGVQLPVAWVERCYPNPLPPNLFMSDINLGHPYSHYKKYKQFYPGKKQDAKIGFSSRYLYTIKHVWLFSLRKHYLPPFPSPSLFRNQSQASACVPQELTWPIRSTLSNLVACSFSSNLSTLCKCECMGGNPVARTN